MTACCKKYIIMAKCSGVKQYFTLTIFIKYASQPEKIDLICLPLVRILQFTCMNHSQKILKMGTKLLTSRTQDFEWLLRFKWVTEPNFISSKYSYEVIMVFLLSNKYHLLSTNNY
jgi:hypothetical protein